MSAGAFRDLLSVTSTYLRNQHPHSVLTFYLRACERIIRNIHCSIQVRATVIVFAGEGVESG